MFLYPYKIFSLSKGKRLINPENKKLVGIHDAYRNNYGIVNIFHNILLLFQPLNKSMTLFFCITNRLNHGKITGFGNHNHTSKGWFAQGL